ncbi:MAG TPA: fibronectin type III domain-containing protein [Pyrinomonadaceae bacterium]|nr:fibronectin type III domain-containing protein [Pyrinomonadaceae bacterium]
MTRRLIAISLLLLLLLSTTPVAPSARTRFSRTAATADVDQQNWLAGLESYAALGQWVISKLWLRSPRAPRMQTAPPVTAFINSMPFFIDAPTNVTVTAASDTSVSLSWTAAAGSVDHYQIERSATITGSFVFLGNATGTTFTDSTVSIDHAYLYRVRTVAIGGALSVPSNLAFGTATTFEFNSLLGQSVKAQHFYDVRTAINAVRAAANLSAATWTRSTLTGLAIQASDVQEMRDRLGEALTALSVSVSGYTDPTLTAGTTLIKAIHLEELQSRSTRGSGAAAPLNSDSSTARVDPLNETGGGGENPLSRNFNWTLPLVVLPGRAGMNLSLKLSYNSLVWTRNGNYITFDPDHGSPSPGFRLGFPVIQASYFNSEVGKNAFLLIGTDGGRTELRQVGTSALYEAADSSHLLLDAGTMILRTTDGTQLNYTPTGSEYNCTQIKDRNGNYLTISYTAFGRIDTVVDTLGRNIKFNYDANGWLNSISQTWNQGLGNQVTHYWAVFAYADIPVDTNFSVALDGPADGSTLKMLSKVTLADSSHYDFSYTSWGQVWKVSRFGGDNHLLNYRSYNLPQTADPQVSFNDCPRFTERRDWAQYWNGDTDDTAATNEEAITTYAIPVADSWTMPDNTAQTGTRAQVTAPDLTSDKIYFIGTAGTTSGWQRELPALVNTYDSSGNWQRQVMTTWTQDNTSVSYRLNPRVTELNTYDPAGNRARVQTTYQQFTFANGTSCQLPRDVYEYATNASTILRSTRTDYNTISTYTDRRIIGLVSEQRLYDGDVNNGGALKSKVGFFYDESGSIQGTDSPVQHDNASYGSAFLAGRGNVSSMRRYDVTNIALFTTTSSKYNTAGATVSTTDAANHVVQVSYNDAFSDNTLRNTLAFATTVTDADGYTSSTQYYFDSGAVTYNRTPQPNTQSNLPGPERTLTYDTIGRLQRVTNVANSAYVRYEYPSNNLRVDTYATIQDGLGEAHSFKIADGAARVIATAMDHFGSVGGYSGKQFVYDIMGRLFKSSNPTETTATSTSGSPRDWSAAGDDAAWVYTQQTYDWKGRPLVTTNPDSTTRTASYTGCGCAGGEVTTLTDEGTFTGGVAKRRQQKTYSDILGRPVKTEMLNWEGGTVYSATVNTYNVRDQIESTIQYAGAEGSAHQDTTMTYDGYGRLQTQHLPEQTAGTTTVWTYNTDDTINTLTDARGASQTFGYNNRHQTTSITYSAPSGIPVPGQVTFTYDGAGNRLGMTDGLGSKTYHYDLLSRLTQETRQFTVGTFTINYTYNLAGQLTSVTDPFNASFTYARDLQGRLNQVTGSAYAGFTNYINAVNYRAWGAPKSVSYPGMNSTISYNSRLEPSQFLLTASSNGASIMRENYSYFADGRLSALTDLDDTPGNNPPATLRYLSRSYAYDHVGRISGSGGTGIGSMPGVPYTQSYSYDQFDNMTTRSGSYYNYTFNPATTDNATYTNNRRTNWSYNAEGQVTSTPSTSTDSPRTMTYDAAGRMVTTVEVGPSNTVTYSVAYDGDGDHVYESSNVSQGFFTASYIVRSTVLDGEVLTRLDQSGNKLATEVPAEGLLFATQMASGGPGPYVLLTQRNPVGTSETSKAVYDPLGNYIPFQASGDPRPPAGSFTSASMSGLSASLANPQSYGGGCLVDRLPTDCNLAMRLLANGSAARCPQNDCGPRMVNGQLTPLYLTEGGFGFWVKGTKQQPKQRKAPTLRKDTPQERAARKKLKRERGGDPFGVGRDEVESFNLDEIRRMVTAALNRPICRDFYTRVLNAANVNTKKNPVLEGADLSKIFDDFMNQKKGGFTRKPVPGGAGFGSPTGLIRPGNPNSNASIFLPPPVDDIDLDFSDAIGAVAEIFHLAGSRAFYDDEQLANAVHNIPEFASKFPLSAKNNVFDPAYQGNPKDPEDGGYSTYFHNIQRIFCEVLR